VSSKNTLQKESACAGSFFLHC